MLTQTKLLRILHMAVTDEMILVDSNLEYKWRARSFWTSESWCNPGPNFHWVFSVMLWEKQWSFFRLIKSYWRRIIIIITVRTGSNARKKTFKIYIFTTSFCWAFHLREGSHVVSDWVLWVTWPVCSIMMKAHAGNQMQILVINTKCLSLLCQRSRNSCVDLAPFSCSCTCFSSLETSKQLHASSFLDQHL